MKIAIAGGTGFIGSKLIQQILELNHQVVVLSRREMSASTTRFPKNAGVTWLVWDGRDPEIILPAIEGASAVLNFAGESLAGKRWTDAQKTKIFDSRIETTKALVSAIERAGHPPKVLLNASAVGFYGNVPNGEVTESFPKGRGFLADLCAQWELEAQRAEKFGVRVVLLRTGIVLDKKDGALPDYCRPFYPAQSPSAAEPHELRIFPLAALQVSIVHKDPPKNPCLWETIPLLLHSEHCRKNRQQMHSIILSADDLPVRLPTPAPLSFQSCCRKFLFSVHLSIVCLQVTRLQN